MSAFFMQEPNPYHFSNEHAYLHAMKNYARKKASRYNPCGNPEKELLYTPINYGEMVKTFLEDFKPKPVTEPSNNLLLLCN